MRSRRSSSASSKKRTHAFRCARHQPRRAETGAFTVSGSPLLASSSFVAVEVCCKRGVTTTAMAPAAGAYLLAPPRGDGIGYRTPSRDMSACVVHATALAARAYRGSAVVPSCPHEDGCGRGC